MGTSSKVFQKGAAVVMALALVFSVVSPFTFPAFAEDTYTVAVNASEGGSVLLDGEETTSAEYAAGETVTLEATADSGYTLEMISAASEETEVEVADSEEGSYSFEMPAADVTVDIVFTAESSTELSESEETSAEASSEDITAEESTAEAEESTDAEAEETVDETEPVDTVEADEDTITDAVMEAYVRENVDSAYIPSVDKMQIVNAVTVKQTMFDGAYTKKTDTIDSVMGAIESGDTSAYSKYIAQTNAFSVVYDLGDENEYCVVYADTMHNDSTTTVRDAAFALADNDGNVLEDCVYDYETGLAYIPKSDLLNDDGEQVLFGVQIQLMQVINFDDTETSVQSSVEEDGVVDVYESTNDYFSVETTVNVEAGLSEDEMTVSVNGVPVSDDYYEYDKETGELTIDKPGSTVLSVSVSVEEQSLLDKAASAVSNVVASITSSADDPLDSISAYALDSWDDMEEVANFGTLEDWVTKGTALIGDAPVMYGSSSYSWTGSYGYDWDEDGEYGTGDSSEVGKDSNVLIKKILTGESTTLDVSKVIQQTTEIYFKVGFKNKTYTLASGKTMTGNTIAYDSTLSNNKYAGDTEPEGETLAKLYKLGNLAMQCAHISESLELDDTGGRDAKKWYKASVMMRFLLVDRENGYAVVGIQTAETNTQTGTALYKITFDSSTTVQVVKSTSDDEDFYEDLVADNDNYTLYGAKYRIYASYDDAVNETNQIRTLTTDSDGESKNTTYYVDENGDKIKWQIGDTFWIKETTNPDGYLKDTSGGQLTAEGADILKDYGNGVYKFEITDSSVVFYAEDIPVYATFGLTKFMAGDDDDSTAVRDFSGTQFNIRYFTEYYAAEDVEDVLTERDLYYAFTLSQNGKGNYAAGLYESDLVGSHSTVITNSAGYMVFPLGTIRLKETKAADGYTTEDMYWVIGESDVLCADSPLVIYVYQDSNGEAYMTATYNGDSSTALAGVSSPYEGVTFQISAYDYSETGTLVVEKVDEQTKEKLAGATFHLVCEDGTTLMPSDDNLLTEEDMAEDGTITIGDDGTATVNHIPIGSYYLVEDTAPIGYLLPIEYTKIDISFHATTTETVLNTSIRGTIEVPKIDRERDTNVAQGDATLEGAEYTIYNAGTDNIYVGFNNDGDCLDDGECIAPGEAVLTVTTDADGIATTAAYKLLDGTTTTELLPYGTYEVVETKAPTGYLLSGYDEIVILDGENLPEPGDTVKAKEDPEEVIRGGIQIQKVDEESADNELLETLGIIPQGDASLAGATFDIINMSAASVLVDTDGDGEFENYEVGDVIDTLTTDEDGFATTSDDYLPYGTYKVVETAAPEGYGISSDTNHTTFTVSIRENGKIYEKSDEGKSMTVILDQRQTDAH